MKKQAAPKFESYWSFGLINNRLAEIFFDRGKIQGHCYVEESEYKTKREKRWIKEDTQKWQLTYRNGQYRNKLTGKIIPKRPFPKIKPGEGIPWEEFKKKFKL